MKTLEKNQFDINKTTMRELTPYELSSVAGGVDQQGKSIIATSIITIIITSGSIPITTIIVTRTTCSDEQQK